MWYSRCKIVMSNWIMLDSITWRTTGTHDDFPQVWGPFLCFQQEPVRPRGMERTSNARERYGSVLEAPTWVNNFGPFTELNLLLFIYLFVFLSCQKIYCENLEGIFHLQKHKNLWVIL